MWPKESNPYDPPANGSIANNVDQSSASLDRIGRLTIMTAILYMLIYIPYFFVQFYRESHGVAVSPLAIVPAHY
jgi:hypothetical protein